MYTEGQMSFHISYTCTYSAETGSLFYSLTYCCLKDTLVRVKIDIVSCLVGVHLIQCSYKVLIDIIIQYLGMYRFSTIFLLMWYYSMGISGIYFC